jgi:hypothetical protein
MFKDLEKKVFGIVNLNDEAKIYVETIQNGDLLDSDFCQKVVEWSAKKYAVDFTYGGFLENRKFLWKGSYLEESGNFIHLGVDYNVPDHTKVYADQEMQIVHVENDYPLRHGWGQMVIGYIEKFDICILYGHLSKENIWKVGDKIKQGEVVGVVGDKNDNGFWFTHLHVQCFTKKYFDEVNTRNTWKEFDGYGNIKDFKELVKIYKDPVNFVSLK